MPTTDPRVDAYIAKAAPFAQPILITLRKHVHAVCPDVEETIKWGFPHFLYKGLLCHMAAFKQHCAFGFWKAHSLETPYKTSEEGMGQFGRITAVGDLPSAPAFKKLVRAAMRLKDSDIKPKRIIKPKEALKIPADFQKALKKNPAAHTAFKTFSYRHRKEYLQWITEAKREETRTRRIETAVAQIADRKSQNWRYERQKAIT